MNRRRPDDRTPSMKYVVSDLVTGCEVSAYLVDAGTVLRIAPETSPLLGIIDLTPGAWEELKAAGDRALGMIGGSPPAEQPVTGEKR
jgi:hypothetical protein